jgi:kynureninase
VSALPPPLPPAQDPLDRTRGGFPIVEQTTYLISNSLGAMPAATAGDLAEYARTWATRGVRAWAEGWWGMAVETGDLVGRIVGAAKGSVTMHQNVTVASAVAASCVPFRAPRNRVVMVDLEFPSLHYLYHRMADRGAEVVTVKGDADGVGVPTERVLDAIDARTALVPISHVLFRSAYVMDAKAIVEKAHAVGARVVLDCFQSAGVVPVDVAALGVDFAVGGCLKWLCGGPGAAWLYARPDLQKTLEPSLTGWQAHVAPFAFEPGPIRARDDGWRFLTGTPNIPALYACRAGLRTVGEIGAAAIREKSLRQTARLVALADREGWKVTAPRDPARRGGTVAFDVPHGAAVSAEMNARDFVVDYRPGAGIRLSPHFYTRDAELDAAVGQVREILETRAYERHLAAKRVVT